jgi:putative SOS response-associated peptidase YedK
MCGRATLSLPPDEIREALGLDVVPDMPARFNIAPTQPMAIIRVPRRLELLRWGLPVPKGARGGSRGINVRLETAPRAPMYRDAFRHRRCLAIVDGFYEWEHPDDATHDGGTASGARGSRGARGKQPKRPFFIHRPDGGPFGLAAIWQPEEMPDGTHVDSCGILTADAKGVVRPLHDRMPVIVPASEFAHWLDAEERDPFRFFTPSADDLVAYAVGPLVNSPQNDDPRCIEPLV